MASILTPSLGIVHEWITSAAVTNIRTSRFIGTTSRLSTSSSRYSPVCSSSVGTIYESNSMFMKSEYSYLQYHWCPTVLIVSDGVFTSSVRYSKCRDGTAKNTRITAGRIVHTVSICWASISVRDENLFSISIMNVYVTTDVTNTRITKA